MRVVHDFSTKRGETQLNFLANKSAKCPTKLVVVGFMGSNAEEWFWLGMMANPKNMDEGFADNIILVGCTHYIMTCGFIHFDKWKERFIDRLVL